MSFYKDAPTKKQMEFIGRLGYRGKAPKTKGDASDLIEQLLEAERQTKGRNGGCMHSLRRIALLAAGSVALITYCAVRDWPPPKPPAPLPANALPAVVPNESTDKVGDNLSRITTDLIEKELQSDTQVLPASEVEPVATENPTMSENLKNAKPVEFRTWSDVTGRFKVEAVYVEYDGENVTLEKRSGENSVVPMNRLSEEDQAWVRNRVLNPQNESEPD
jgi:hypothetical protein